MSRWTRARDLHRDKERRHAECSAEDDPCRIPVEENK